MPNETIMKLINNNIIIKSLTMVVKTVILSIDRKEQDWIYIKPSKFIIIEIFYILSCLQSE